MEAQCLRLIERRRNLQFRGGPIVSNSFKHNWIVVALALLSGAGVVTEAGRAAYQGSASTASLSPSAAQVPADKAAAADSEVKQLLLLMDTDKNGKISKKEFMAFMEAEFNRLDVNKDGELDVKELSQEAARSLRSFGSGPSRPR